MELEERIENAKNFYQNFSSKKFRPGQMEAVKECFKSNKKLVVIIAPTGCLAADSIINYNRCRLGRKTTIKNLYLSSHGERRKGKGVPVCWKKDTPTRVRSYNGKTIGLQIADGFFYSGVRVVWKLILENGKSIRATPDHKIMTKSGWKRMDCLNDKDEVMCDTVRPVSNDMSLRKKKERDLFVYNLWNHPYASKVRTNKDARGWTKRVEIHRAIYEAHLNGLSLDEYKRILRYDKLVSDFLDYVDPNIFHIHHKNFIHSDNRIENLEQLNKSDHAIAHKHYKNFHQGVPVYSRVISVKPDGIDETYDISSPAYENFIANGIVVHNSGKSLIAMALGNMYNRFMYASSSKPLQDQIVRDFPETMVMKGRGNYVCKRQRGKMCDECLHTKSNPCQLKRGGCDYEDYKRRVVAHPRQVLNYHYWITESNFVGRFSGYPIVICDEADSLEGILSEFISIDISYSQCVHYNLNRPPFKSFSANGAVEAWRAWCQHSKGKIIRQIEENNAEMEELGPGAVGDNLRGMMIKAKRLGALYTKISGLENYMDDTWICEYNSEVQRWRLKPSWMSNKAVGDTLWKHGEKFVFLSATFPPIRVLAELMGISVDDIDVFEIPSSFPAENRPVELRYAGDMKRGKDGVVGEGEIRKIVEDVRGLLDGKHREHKGVIHTVNWRINMAIMEGIKDRRLVTHKAGNKEEVLGYFKASDEPLVFVSPSSTRGLDLPDDQCRWCYIAKAPFLSLGDKLVSSRVYGKKGLGQLWFQSMCAQEIVQAAGRGVRHEKDWCFTYIGDVTACNLISKHPNLFPEYFREGVEQGFF